MTHSYDYNMKNLTWLANNCEDYKHAHAIRINFSAIKYAYCPMWHSNDIAKLS